MNSWTGIPELKDSYRQLGAVRFWALMFGMLAWIGFYAWLEVALEYPQSAGSTCTHKCLIQDFWFSGYLIHHGGWKGLALFAWIWTMPATILAALFYRLLKTVRGDSHF